LPEERGQAFYLDIAGKIEEWLAQTIAKDEVSILAPV